MNVDPRTILDECERAERGGSRHERDAAGKLARHWRLMWTCLGVVCIAAFMLASAAWIYSVYFPAGCSDTPLPSSSSSSSSWPTTVIIPSPATSLSAFNGITAAIAGQLPSSRAERVLTGNSAEHYHRVTPIFSSSLASEIVPPVLARA